MAIRDIGIWIEQRAPFAGRLMRSVYRSLPEFIHDTPTSRAQSYFEDRPDVQFVQIGAYDGSAGDRLRPLIMKNPSWSGLLIEPQRHAFESLKKNYFGESARLQFINGLLSDKQGQEELFFIPEREIAKCGLHDWANEVASTDASHLWKHFPGVLLKSELVMAYTFDQLAKLLPTSRVDLVVMDVEGAEKRLIDSIDFEVHSVSFLIFEHKHMGNRDFMAVSDLLKSMNFELKSFGRDTIAWRR